MSDLPTPITNAINAHLGDLGISYADAVDVAHARYRKWCEKLRGSEMLRESMTHNVAVTRSWLERGRGSAEARACEAVNVVILETALEATE